MRQHTLSTAGQTLGAPGQTLSQLIDAQVAATPDATAVWAAEGELTYAELNDRAARLARELQARGAVRGSVVGVCLDRGLDLVVALIGVMQAGAAYLPISPEDPADRIAFMLRDSGAGLVVTRAAATSLLPADVGAVAVDRDARAIADRPPVPPEPDLTSDDLVYVIYTSGSTGVPKGVLVPYRGVVNRIRWMQRVHRLTPAGRVLQKTPFTFDVSVWEFFWPLVTGGQLVMAPPGAHRDPQALAELIARCGVTHVHFVPSMLEAFLDVVPEFPGCVEKVFCSGEALRPDAARQLLARSRAVLYNLYGPTEASIEVTACTVSPDDDPVPIGAAIDNVSTPILGEDLALVPDGVTGELCLGGACVVWGYAGRAGLTAERFVPDPNSDVPGARIYRTGDRARRRPDGQIEFMGRADGQVKLRGLRIELGEIEAALTSHPAVASAAVVLAAPPAADPFLVGYLAAATNVALPDDGELRAWLARQLPAYMIPTRYLTLPEMPLTPSGKTDRGALPPVAAMAGEPRGEADETSPPHAPAGPRSPAERAVADAWAEVFGVRGIDADRDFFEIGGNSLLAARIVVRVSTRLGVWLPPAALLENPTIAGLARRAMTAPPAAPAAARPAGPASDEGPLAPGQHRLWLASQLDGGLAAYNIPAVVDIRGPLDTGLLQACLDQLVTRHAALRTAFSAAGDEVVQRISPATGIELVQPGNLPAADWEPWAQQFAARPFDLTCPPLIRAALLTSGGDRHRLVLSLHHLVADAWTLRLLMNDLGETYSALAKGAAPAPAGSPLRYLDYAAGQAARLRDGEFAGQLAYWRAELADLPAPAWLPAATAGTRPAGPGLAETAATTTEAAGATRTVRRTVLLRGGLPGELRGLAAQHRTTLFVTLLAGFAALLHRWSGQEDLVIGAPFGDRAQPGTEQLAGFFVSTAAIRLRDVPDSASFAEVITQARRVVAQAAANQDVPFDVIQHDLGRGGQGVPFRVWFNLLGEPTAAPLMADLSTEMLDPPVVGALFDLNVYVTEQRDDVRIDLVFDSATLDLAHMDELLPQYEWLLRQAAADQGAPIGSHPLAAASAAAPADRPATATAQVPEFPSLTEPAAAWARREPGRRALVSTAGDLSYARLGGWAGGIAAWLRAAGIGRGDVVAVYAQRDPALIAGLLGVLDAGAAFCVLDPAYPASRLAAQVQAARPAALLGLAAAGPVPAGLARLVPLTYEIGAEPLAGPPLAGLAGDRLAYVAFTSGTTGEPKAVPGDHAPVAHFIDHYAASFALGGDDRFALLAGLGHDPLLRDVFTPLQVGGSLHIPPPSLLRDPAALLGWLAAERVTVAHVTPPLIRLLAGAGTGTGKLPSLRLVVCGGDVLRGADVASVRDLAPAATVVNAYGATETPQIMAWLPITPGLPWDATADDVPVGTAIDGVDLAVVRGDGRPAAVGELGRIVIRTPYLTRDYLASQEFRTDDLGRLRPDGRMALAGRADRQVKVRGFRVDPGTIDAVIRAMPGIDDCVTVPDIDPDGETRLVSYLVPVPGAVAPTELLRRELRAGLPAHMRPAALVTLPGLPLSPNGKVDTAGLPRWEPGADGGADPAEAPATTLEKQIASVWADVLHATEISAGASFFDLGGSSLLMARAGQRLSRELGRPVPVLMLFEYPTVRTLARHLEEPQVTATADRTSRRLASPDARRRVTIRREIQREAG